MIVLRSLAFQILFYGNLAGQLLLYLPIFFVAPRRVCWWIVNGWARSSLWLLRHVAGTKAHISGTANIPRGAAIIAAKHQSFWDVFALIPHVDRPAFILKKELMAIPVFGWYARRMEMIPVDRSKRGAVITALVEEAQKAVASGRQIIIFPEGTRTAPDAAPNYRPGIHALYAGLDVPAVPVALNSGLFWPRRAFRREPGTIRAEFLPPIAPGLSREDFLAELSARIETRTAALMRQALAERPDLAVSDRLKARLSDGT